MWKTLRALYRHLYFGPQVEINYRVCRSWALMRALYKERGKL